MNPPKISHQQMGCLFRLMVGICVSTYLWITHRYEAAITFFHECLQLAEYLPMVSSDIKLFICSKLFLGYMQIGDLNKTLFYFRKTFQSGRDVGRTFFESHGVATIYANFGRYEDAVKYFEKALAETHELYGHKRFLTLQRLGSTHFFFGNYLKALKAFEECLEIAKEAKEKSWELELYFKLSQTARVLSKLDKAKEYQARHLRLAKEAGNRIEECKAYVNIGNYKHDVGEFKEAMTFHVKQLKIAKEIRDKVLERHAYSCIGRISSHFGNFKEAIKNLELSLEMTKDEGDIRAVGEAYGNIGNAYKSNGEYGRAIESFEQSLDIALRIRDKATEVSARHNLASTYRILGDKEKAILHLKTNLEICKEMGDRTGEGKALQSLGNVYCGMGNLSEALKCQKKALEIYTVTIFNHGFASICGTLGLTFMKAGNSQEALKYSYDSLHSSTQMGYRDGEIQALSTISNVYHRVGDHAKALEYSMKWCKASRESGQRNQEAMSFLKLGIVHEELKDLEKAQKSYLRSINLYDEINKDLGNRDKYKVSYGEYHHIVCKRLSNVLIQRSKPEEALVTEERGRARALADLMRFNYQVQDSREAERKPLDAGGIKKTVDQCGTSTIVTSVPLDGFLSLWVVQPNDEIQLRKSPAQNSPELGNAKLKSLIDGLYQEVLGPEEDTQCEDRSLTVLFGDQKQRKTSSRSMKASDFDFLIKSMQEVDMTEVNRGQGRHAFDSFQRNQSHLRSVYDVVIAPVADLLQTSEIIIVPDDCLHLVPMAALKDGGGQFLTETFRIRVLPSLKTMSLIQSCSPDYHSQTGALIVGDPKVGTVEFQRKITRFPRLEFARKEAEMIGQLLHVAPLTGDQATKEEVLKQMAAVALIHIAAHGDMESGEIALAPNPTHASQIPKKVDFLLSMADVHRARLRAKLVVLSSCHSGRGKIKAEGVVGIARAFLGAGARSVLVSLWAVDDRATMMFMRSFYEHLHGGESASEALHQAMKCLRESQQFSNVKYWAPFVLIGDDVKLEFK